ncbi:hypothetical protein [Leisingera sp. ANG-M6]|uniref:hypothetical protein n=1 Tax=Leisingera sp. ANG-M6 TaxID=1577900 RepID=UPI00057D8327|nr:hypothetical protein [Leisingera sp. ANG-M6]KIC31174.1 hypothetical protein RA24_00490 [Leisingera sp. ANG-M6]
MNSSDLLRHLRRDGAVRFTDEKLFDGHAWYFPTRTGSEYEDFRSVLGGVFGVAASDVAIVGSGKYGFSMAPGKNFRAFQPSEEDESPSDIDLVVVSKGLFNSTWKHLRTAHYNGAIDARRMFQGDVFRRFIMIGTEEYRDTMYLRDLMLLLQKARKQASTRLGIAQQIKVRIYSSWADVKSYHIWSLEKLGEEHGIQ